MPSPEPTTEPHTTEPMSDQARTVAAFLERLVADPGELAVLPKEDRERLLKAAGVLARPGLEQRKIYMRAKRRQRLLEKRAADTAVLDRTGMRVQSRETVYPSPVPAKAVPEPPPSPGRVGEPRNCYVCKTEYHDIHGFYDSMCAACGEHNWIKRHQSADLEDRVALLTGGRVKIGYQTGIKLLRAGARLIVTTRFPRDAAARYAKEPDFGDWSERLDVYGLDLRHTPSVEALCQHVCQRYDRLDVLINNACQTVRRPPGFYTHLMESEAGSMAALPDAVRGLVADYEELRRDGRLVDAAARGQTGELAGIDRAAALSQLPLVEGDVEGGEQLFPAGRLDADLQQVDLRERNSWRLTLAEVPTVELLEVQLVNAIAPYVLNARLKPMMLRSPRPDRYVVNVSAMEGQFYRGCKTDKHPHTNMAKAALNMMTRTSAADYQRDGIYMNSVDTGWITDEDPMQITLRKRAEHGFHCPLDHVDAAARILDPVFAGVNTGEPVWGEFLKDYAPTKW